jgi:hypothetical protein
MEDERKALPRNFPYRHQEHRRARLDHHVVARTPPGTHPCWGLQTGILQPRRRPQGQSARVTAQSYQG